MGDGKKSTGNSAFARMRAELKEAKEKVAALEKKAEPPAPAPAATEPKVEPPAPAATEPKVEPPAPAPAPAPAGTDGAGDKLVAGIKELLDAELADIPEDKRDLIPALDELGKLRWLQNAKKKGVFRTEPPAPKPGTSSGAPPPGNGKRGNQLERDIEKARRSGNPALIAAAFKRKGSRR